MYNGVGVQTARSTGTSGHVVKSLGQLQPRRIDIARAKERKGMIPVRREEDPDISLHNALRKIEVTLAEYREELEDEYVLIFFPRVH
jgi:serine/arginine repetitive matrix protein 2